MRSLLKSSTLLLGATLFGLAQADSHAHEHAHEIRNLADVLPALERDAESLAVRHEGSSGGNGGWNGGSYEYKGYGGQDNDDGNGGRNGGKGKSETTITVDVTEIMTEGMSTVAAAGDHKTTIMETMTMSAAAATATVSMGNGQQGGQTT